jgi:hypothetical protein
VTGGAGGNGAALGDVAGEEGVAPRAELLAVGCPEPDEQAESTARRSAALTTETLRRGRLKCSSSGYFPQQKRPYVNFS